MDMVRARVAYYLVCYYASCIIVLHFLLENSLYFGVNELISFQKLVGNLNRMTVPKIFGLLFQDSLRMFVFGWGYKLLFHKKYIA